MEGTLNILRTAYQIPDIAELSEVQRHMRLEEYKGQPAVVTTTRRMPTRRGEVLDGGSIYWIIKNSIQCRQKILGMEMVEEDADSKYCRFYLDPQIVRVVPKRKRAVQGWRYLQGWDCPQDLGPYDPDNALPDHIEKELRDIGVL